MIASENYVSAAVKQAVGSVLMNKYSEGQVGKRYYQGNQNIDKIEATAKERALKAFKLNPSKWGVNVQAANGSAANLAAYNALLAIGDKMLSMYLFHGGHLSHGWQLDDGTKVSMTSKIYKPHYYYVDPKTQKFNYAEIEKTALKVKPKILISGGTAYPPEINHKKMADIAKKVGAYYMADIAHEAGLVLTGANKSPFKYADIVTMTTRKTLRGPIGAMIFSRKELSERIDRSVFPGLQGGPLNHSIAGIAAALSEAMKPGFKKYSEQILKNAKTLAKELSKRDFTIISGGTEKHLILIDLSNKGIDGWYTAWALDYAGIITNRSTFPGDTGSPYYPNGLRLGTPAITTRGMKEKQMIVIASWIDEVVGVTKELVQKSQGSRKQFKLLAQKDKTIKSIEIQVKALCAKFPVP